MLMKCMKCGHDMFESTTTEAVGRADLKSRKTGAGGCYHELPKGCVNRMGKGDSRVESRMDCCQNPRRGSACGVFLYLKGTG